MSAPSPCAMCRTSTVPAARIGKDFDRAAAMLADDLLAETSSGDEAMLLTT
jgi:hypothetical protein